ncbi:IPT/TIG domain-containing protein [Micromonospora sp. ATA32]|nr:IPT/TIG domain-containing protein [Micromonospora sp. ATA32]
MPAPGEPPSQGNGITAGCAGTLHTVQVTDPGFVDGGGSPFEGQQRPLCDTKLVQVRGGQASAPNFNLFTPVPLPTHFWGLVINDLGLTRDKRSSNYGEAEGIPNVPVGLYDFAGRLVDTVDTDFNGMYEAIEPSTSTYNCPLPAGPCPNMYRFVGNDPGQPGHVNGNYNPRYRTIATNFQAWPGLYTVTDTAPTQVAAVGISPGSGQLGPVQCDPAADSPQLFAVSRPFLRSTDTDRRITITGSGFGARGPRSAVSLAGDVVSPSVTVNSWSDRRIEVTIGASQAAPFALTVTADNGQQTTNGLTLQLLGATVGTGIGGAANPRLFQVAPPPRRCDPARRRTPACSPRWRRRRARAASRSWRSGPTPPDRTTRPASTTRTWWCTPPCGCRASAPVAGTPTGVWWPGRCWTDGPSASTTRPAPRGWTWWPRSRTPARPPCRTARWSPCSPGTTSSSPPTRRPWTASGSPAATSPTSPATSTT